MKLKPKSVVVRTIKSSLESVWHCYTLKSEKVDGIRGQMALGGATFRALGIVGSIPTFFRVRMLACEIGGARALKAKGWKIIRHNYGGRSNVGLSTVPLPCRIWRRYLSGSGWADFYAIKFTSLKRKPR